LDTLTPRPSNNITTPTNQPSSNNHPANATKQRQTTPTPHRLPKLLSTAFSFFTAGTNDGSLGALLPYILRSYGITTALVSSLYAGTLAGWLLAALTATHLAQRLRLGSLLCLGAALQAVAHALRCWYVKWAF
jgi:fucose permease